MVEIIIPIAFLLVAFETRSGHGDLLFPSSASVASGQLPSVVELVFHPPPPHGVKVLSSCDCPFQSMGVLVQACFA